MNCGLGIVIYYAVVVEKLLDGPSHLSSQIYRCIIVTTSSGMDQSIINVWQQTNNPVRHPALLLVIGADTVTSHLRDVSLTNCMRATTLSPMKILVLVFMTTILVYYTSSHLLFLTDIIDQHSITFDRTPAVWKQIGLVVEESSLKSFEEQIAVFIFADNLLYMKLMGFILHSVDCWICPTHRF